jgi:hypothetical protein
VTRAQSRNASRNRHVRSKSKAAFHDEDHEDRRELALAETGGKSRKQDGARRAELENKLDPIIVKMLRSDQESIVPEGGEQHVE